MKLSSKEKKLLKLALRQRILKLKAKVSNE